MVDYFNHIFLGENGDGLIRKEQWMPRDGLLEELWQHADTRHLHGRAKYRSRRHAGPLCAAHIHFDPIITDESVANPKPAPDGLELIKQQYPGKTDLVSRRHRRRCSQRAIRRRAVYRRFHAAQSAARGDRGQLCAASAHSPSSTDINELEALVHRSSPHKHERSDHRTQHQGNPDHADTAHRRHRASMKSQPASVFLITCWNCSASTVRSI